MSTLVIPEPRLDQPAPGTWRVTAKIARQEIYFEAPVPLSPRIEAFVCVMTLPAMQRHMDIVVRAPLSPVLIENLRQARTLARQWWPNLRPSELCAPTGTDRKRAPGTGLFFTGGVDSSFALSRLQKVVHELLYVEGFDVKLTDTARLQEVRRWLEIVAAATGHRLTIIRTNLRSHRLFKCLHWDLTHVAALAAVAHLLGDRLGTVYVADTDAPAPFGSHPELDKFWSSGSVALVNYGAEYTRLQRVAAIRNWPPLRGHLRVCWEHRAATLNCGRCEKCVRTRLELLAAGDPTGMNSFPDLPVTEALEQLVEAAPHVHLPNFWRNIQAALPDQRQRELIDMLLARSLQPRPRPTLFKRVKRRLNRLVGRRTSTH